jgi:hypothetical protein
MTSSIVIPARKLREMLGAVMPHAGDDDTLPVLNAVQFEIRGGELFTVATDRYTIGVARCAIPGAKSTQPPWATANLMLAEARELAGLISHADVAALTFTDDLLEMDGGPGARASWTLHAVEYPDWRTLMSNMLAGEPAELPANYGLSPLHLAKFRPDEVDDRQYCRAPLRMRLLERSDRKGVVLHSGERFPVFLVTRGDWFLGALMPTRIDPAEFGEPDPDPWAEWTALLPPAEQAPAEDAGKPLATATK